jgi:L-ornithine Nalpha-acyltransferase
MLRDRVEIPPIQQRSLEARLAANEADVDAAQALRYRVFYDEMSARPSSESLLRKRDADEFDSICDHILVIDHDSKNGAGGQVVGTYRLLRRSVAERHGGFYSASEYDLSCLVNCPGEIMELGRSCVDAEHRTRPTMQLLWSAIAAYVFRYEISLMFGCASLPGTDPQALGPQLSYLYHQHLAPPEIRLHALPKRYVDMRIVPEADLDPRVALAGLPPLIKGYLRLGGFVGDGAVIDHQFNTTDVSIVVRTDLITEKYFRHYEREWRDATAG